MILNTPSGEFQIPAAVAQRLPNLPALPSESSPNYKRLLADFERWLDADPQHVIDYERLRRWHLVQNELAATAMANGQSFVVTTDGLD